MWPRQLTMLEAARVLLVSGWITPQKSVIKRLKAIEEGISGGIPQGYGHFKNKFMSQKTHAFKM